MLAFAAPDTTGATIAKAGAGFKRSGAIWHRADAGYTTHMKTAVSIPDRIFRSAERLAARWGISRSALYAKALDALLEKHSNESVTSQLNDVYGPKGGNSSLDPALPVLQQRTLKRNI
jgi:hypothetical protein